MFQRRLKSVAGLKLEAERSWWDRVSRLPVRFLMSANTTKPVRDTYWFEMDMVVRGSEEFSHGSLQLVLLCVEAVAAATVVLPLTSWFLALCNRNF